MTISRQFFCSIDHGPKVAGCGLTDVLATHPYWIILGMAVVNRRILSSIFRRWIQRFTIESDRETAYAADCSVAVKTNWLST